MESGKFLENSFHDNPLSPGKELDMSMSSDSTNASPYYYHLSFSSEGSSSRESFEDHRRKPRKKPLDEEEKSKYVININAIMQDSDIRTTVMIKNIPNKYTKEMILSAIDRFFARTYDFFYLPIDFKNKCNVGYAFINFKSHRTIRPFFEEFNGKRWERFNSEKLCALAYGRIQGLISLVQHFKSSCVMNQDDPQVRPLILPS